MSPVALFGGMLFELVVGFIDVVKTRKNLTPEEQWTLLIEAAESFHGKVDWQQRKDLAEYEAARGPR